jgi:hypothetical protein
MISSSRAVYKSSRSCAFAFDGRTAEAPLISQLGETATACLLSSTLLVSCPYRTVLLPLLSLASLLYCPPQNGLRGLVAATPVPPTATTTTPACSLSLEPVSNEVCGNFAVHARTSVNFNGVQTTIDGGDVGASPGTSITGDYNFLDGGNVVTDSSAFAASVLAAHTAAIAAHPNEKPMAIEMGGLTFRPGTYRSGSAINFAYGTTVTLDGNNEANPVFLFIAPDSTLITGADTYFILKNGAKAENVLWALGTGATLGARSVVEGSILAGTAITFGTQSILHGCALAQSAVTFESQGYIKPKATGNWVTVEQLRANGALESIERVSSMETLRIYQETVTFTFAENASDDAKEAYANEKMKEYNRLQQEVYCDPFQREILFSFFLPENEEDQENTEGGRRLGKKTTLQLISGAKCNGCGNDSSLYNQVSRKKRRRTEPGSDCGGSGNVEGFPNEKEIQDALDENQILIGSGILKTVLIIVGVIENLVDGIFDIIGGDAADVVGGWFFSC